MLFNYLQGGAVSPRKPQRKDGPKAIVLNFGRNITNGQLGDKMKNIKNLIDEVEKADRRIENIERLLNRINQEGGLKIESRNSHYALYFDEPIETEEVQQLLIKIGKRIKDEIKGKKETLNSLNDLVGGKND